MQHFGAGVRIAHEDSFGQLQFQAFGRQPGLLQDSAYFLDERLVAEFQGRDVDCNRNRRAQRGPLFCFATCLQ